MKTTRIGMQAAMLLAAVAAMPAFAGAAPGFRGISARDYSEAKDVAIRASGCHYGHDNRIGVKAHQRAAKKARNVRRHRRACRG